MADDDLRIEFHLSSKGWVRGNTSFFGHPSGEKIKRPVNTVETCELHVYQRSAWSKEERTWSSKWKSPKVSDKELKKLYKKYPKPNEDYLE